MSDIQAGSLWYAFLRQTSWQLVVRFFWIGLIFRLPRQPKRDETQMVILPEELSALFAALFSSVTAAPTEGEALLADLTTLLSFIQQKEAKAIHKGRWFSFKD